MVTHEAARPEKHEKVARREASTILARPNTLPSLLMALLFCILATFAAYTVVEGGVYFFTEFDFSQAPGQWISVILTVILAVLLSLLLVLPLWLGKLRLAGLISAGDDPRQTELFYYFRRESFGRALRIGLMLVLLYALPVLAVIGLFSGAMNGAFLLSDGGTLWFYRLLLPAFLPVALVLSLGVLFLSGIFFPFLALAVGNEALPLKQVFFLSVRAGKKHAVEIFLYSMRALLWLAVSLCTVGVLYVLWFSHHYTLSYLRFSMLLVPAAPEKEEPVSAEFTEEELI